MADSSSWEHSVPSPDTHLMPLNSGGLWDAVIMTPAVTSSWVFTKYCKAGVGTIPRSMTSTPMDMSPEDTAEKIIGDDTRVSTAMAMGPGPRTWAMALPTFIDNSQSRYSLAIPRIPLVPNIFI